MAAQNSRRLPKGVYRYATAQGTRYVAMVRVAGFKDCSRAFAKPQDAAAWAAETRAELKALRKRGGEPRADLSQLTVGGLIREYLADPSVKALRTYVDVKQILEWWVAECGSIKVLDFGALHLRAARDKLQHGRAAGTVHTYLSKMRTAWNFARAAQIVPQERMWPSRLMPKQPPGRSRHLTDDELERLLEAARQRGAAFHAAVLVSIATGLRQGELLRLTWADIDFERSTVRVLQTKTDTPRAVHLPSVALETLKALRKESVVSATHIFLGRGGRRLDAPTLLWPWRQTLKESRLKDFRWHDLRHSCASFLAQHGATLLEIGSVLGHKSPSMTLRYAHLLKGAAVTGHSALDEKLRGGS
jgi:integrase